MAIQRSFFEKSPAQIWRGIQSYFQKHTNIAFGICSTLVFGVLFREFIFSSQMLMAHDVIESAIPYLKFFGDYWSAHHAIPLWDPYHFCGIPFIDAIHGHSGALYPFTFISLIGSIPRAIGFNMILHYVAATIFAFMAARQFGLRPWAAAFVAFAYGLSPTLVSWVYPGHDGKLFVAAWFPLAVYLTERVRTLPSIWNVVCLGLAIATSILTPHLQAVLYVLILLLLYAVFHIAFDLFEKKPAVRSVRFAVWMAVAAVIGLSVSSVQWIPGYRHISEYSPRAEEERGVDWADTYSINSEELVSVFLPQFTGVNIIGQKYSYWGKNEFKDNSEAMGILPCLLALLAFFLPGYRRQKIIWAAVAVLVLLYSLGKSTPIFQVILTLVPPLDRMRAPSTSMFVGIFAIAVLSGIGLQSLVDRLTGTTRDKLTAVKYIVLGSSILFTILWLISLTAGEQLVRVLVSIFHPAILSQDGGATDKWQLALNNIPSLQTGLFVGALVTAALWAALFGGGFGKWTNYRLAGVILLLVFGSYQFDQRFINTFPIERIFADNPVTKFVRTYQKEDRTLGYPVPTRWYNMTYWGIYSPGGVNDKAISWYVDLIGGRAQTQLLNPRIINLTGTHYMVAPATQQISQYYGGSKPLQVAMQYDQTVVHRNDNSLPRAYFADEVRVMNDLNAIHDSVQTGQDSLRNIVYLEKPVIMDEDTSSPMTSSATIVNYSPDSVVIAVNTSRDRVLVLTDTHHPNWAAYVDGQKTEVLRAYGAFRAVVVPAGSKTVTFRYEDGLHAITMTTSLATLGACMILLGFGWYRRRAPA